MENKNMNKNINVEELEDVSGGFVPWSVQSSPCAICGKITPNLNLVDHHHNKICKSCMKEINNR